MIRTGRLNVFRKSKPTQPRARLCGWNGPVRTTALEPMETAVYSQLLRPFYVPDHFRRCHRGSGKDFYANFFARSEQFYMCAADVDD